MKLKYSIIFLLSASFVQCSEQAPKPVHMGEDVVPFTQDVFCNQVKRTGYGCGAVLCYVGCCGCEVCAVVCDGAFDNRDIANRCEHWGNFCWRHGDECSLKSGLCDRKKVETSTKIRNFFS